MIGKATDRCRGVSTVALMTVMLAVPACSPPADEPPAGPDPSASAGEAPMLSSAATPAPENAPPSDSAEGPDCCSCAVVSGKTFADPRLPCLFDYPVSWEAKLGDDGALISAVAGPPPQSCDTICPNGTPVMAVSYGTTHDSNADTMLSIWPMAMPVVGDGRCGEGTVRFFSPPGADETGFLGGVKFYVQVGGEKYGGAAQFTCGQPGGWLRLRDMFIDSFRDNPESTFPGG